MAARKDQPVGRPVAPALPRALERITADAFMRHSRWEDVELLDADLALTEAVEPRLTSVRIDGGDVGDAKLRHLTIEDSELLRVSAANVKADGATLRHTRFAAVRMTGVDLAQAELWDVSFEECRMDFASFNRARLQNVLFQDCILRDIDFGAARFSRVRFDRCDLSLAEFGGATFGRCEMRGCTFDDAKNVDALRGVAMPHADIIGGAVTWAGALGISVLGDED